MTEISHWLRHKDAQNMSSICPPLITFPKFDTTYVIVFYDTAILLNVYWNIRDAENKSLIRPFDTHHNFMKLLLKTPFHI